jgi:hypothetical protein
MYIIIIIYSANPEAMRAYQITLITSFSIYTNAFHFVTISTERKQMNANTTMYERCLCSNDYIFFQNSPLKV